MLSILRQSRIFSLLLRCPQYLRTSAVTLGTTPDWKLLWSNISPDVVFHLAAQPLVRGSYADPLGTYATNVMGTAHVLEAVRKTPSVRAAVCITTDKCYRNDEDHRPYKETDPLGGHDPYSSSKACAEIVTAAYRSSFFSTDGSRTSRGGGDRASWQCDWRR